MRLATILSAIATVLTTTSPALAVQLGDGTVYFNYPPLLIGATTTYKEVNVWGSIYYFTLNLSGNAGEPLQKVELVQRQGTQQIRFDLKHTEAFIGTQRKKEQRLSLAGVTKDDKTQAISINFAPPVPPGETITIALHPYQNPQFSGVYLFGVTAYPAGEKSHGQFLGFGRLQFYEEDIAPFGFPFGLP